MFSYEYFDEYYNELHLFTKDDLALFVEVGWLTQEQANKIMGIESTTIVTATDDTASSSTAASDSMANSTATA